ncbi:unnamed protein product [Rotaria sp. Silwood1]|nr:unnamed protein product [Rotaria sp. Silwood1]CAF1464935.1 unnamed protein product [Rotaria sp. Silwood1]
MFYDSFPINTSIHHTAIILTKTPSIKVLKHLNALLNVGIDAFVMCDQDPSNFNNSTNRILYISDEQLALYGLTRNRVWDRVFVWLYNQSSIDYVWLMEEDVTWSNVRYMVKLFNVYANNPADLLSRNIIYRNKHTLGWMWWPTTSLKLFPEKKWSGSLNMLSRVSRRLIKAHQYYTLQLLNETKQNNASKIDSNYYYQEFFIPTVANMFNLKMLIYDHSLMEVHVSSLTENDIRTLLAKGKHIFHAVKHDSQLLINATQY